VNAARGRTVRRLAAVVVLALVGGVAAPGVAGAAEASDEADRGRPPRCRPGAPGIGDAYYPTYGNGGYNVRDYDIDVAYDPATDRLAGETTIDARATQELCSFNLDLVGLTVRRVSVDGARAQWSRSGQELVVTPESPLGPGRGFEVTVRYDGVPVEFVLPGTDIRTGFMATPEGLTVAGQPEVAASWFPVNDHPLDKALYSFDVTVPRGYEVVANGFLQGRSRARDGGVRWRWHAREPMASYLATIDIADWDVHEWETDDGLPVYDAVDTSITGGLRAEIDDSFSRQGEILDLLSEAFGPYPFETVGGIVPAQDDLVFALETQTRAVYGTVFWQDDAGNPVDADWVVVHELAHQWYGDDVALARWQDIWLNEGFATYAEWLWEEHEGRATPQEIFDATYAGIPADDPFWSVVIGDPGVDLLFDNAVYVRGAMALQALRNEVGDDAFFDILQTWAASKSGGNGTTPEFIALAERLSGQQLDALFRTWLFTPSKPAAPSSSEVAALSAPESAASPASSAPNWLSVVSARPRAHPPSAGG
jgi:aminopeptidase N